MRILAVMLMLLLPASASEDAVHSEHRQQLIDTEKLLKVVAKDPSRVDESIQELRALGSFPMTRELLKRTGIARYLNMELRKHSHDGVKAAASDVIKLWTAIDSHGKKAPKVRAMMPRPHPIVVPCITVLTLRFYRQAVKMSATDYSHVKRRTAARAQS
jgi:hypothetical protein